MTDAEFSGRYMAQLNSQQQEAVRATEGAVLLLAVPGSGKTTVLVTRLGYMAAVRGVDPGKILTMTYTVDATKDMRSRYASLFGADAARRVSFRTINSLSLDIVRYYSGSFGKAEMFHTADNGEATRIAGEVYRGLTKEYATESVLKDFCRDITYVKNMMLSEEEIQAYETDVERFPELFARYQKVLRNRRLMDFDDQMVYAHTILKSYPAVLEHYQARFPFLCVDESQDTSKIQHKIIRLLAQKHGNIFMVGDEDQSIYGFRAAYPEALLRFREDYPGAKVLLMEQNYRSTREIVAAAGAFVARSGDRYEKHMQAVRGNGAQVQVIQAKNREAQFWYLTELARTCGEQTAVLYRNHESALPLINLLDREGIPYACRNFDTSFFSNRVVADISDIIRFAYDRTNAALFLRIYYKFGTPIPKAAAVPAAEKSAKTGKPVLEELLAQPELSVYGKEAVRELSDQLSALPRDNAEEAVKRIWYAMRYGLHVRDRRLDEKKCRVLCMLGRKEPSAEALLRRLEELKTLVQTHRNEEDAVFLLSTIHASKGLEYRNVYLLDVLDGILPSVPEQEDLPEADRRRYQEERRIFYVGMTRAKEQLHLFRCRGEASAFASEVSASLPEEVRDKEDVFSSLKRDLLGRSYHDREHGRGTVAAQCGDTLLLEFHDGAFRLLTLAEMWSRRDPARQYVPPKAKEPSPQPPAQPEQGGPTSALQVGITLRHKKFGPGVVTELDPAQDRIRIRFGDSGETKTFKLRSSLDRGLLQY